MSMQSADEMREHPRIEFNQLVRIKSHAGESMQLLGINYSLSGMGLNSPRPLPLGEFVDVIFKINELAKKEFSITAEVVQNIKHSNMYITGIRFLGGLNYSG